MKKADKSASSRAKSDKAAKPAKKAAAPRAAKPAGKGKAGKAAKAQSAEVKVDKVEGKAAPRGKAGKGKVGKVGRGKPQLDAGEQAELPLAADAPAEGLVERTAGDTGDAPAESEPTTVELSEEEKELSSIYGEDLAAPTLAHAEFKDQKTADEDRPMLPEINARDERRRSWEDRRERRRLEREQRRAARRDRQGRGFERGGHGGAAGPGGHGGRPEGADRRDERGPGGHGGRPEGADRRELREGRPERPALPPPSAPAAVGAAPAAVSASSSVAPPAAPVATSAGMPMAAATAALFVQLRNGQPLPVRQLAAMLRKRSLIEGDPEQVWPQLRAELLADERSHRAIGLRPRVVHRGRDLFAPGPAALSGSSELEGQLAAAVAAISAATVRGLSAWMASASPAAFERLIHAYVIAIGYRDVEWIKRVDGISYASAIAPGLERPVLLSARAGGAPIDRRGIGELRVGVEAKGLPFGTLFAAAGLSPEAERELERPGRSIYVVCADALATALVAAGIGVAATAVSVRLLDEQFLDDLGALPA